MKHLNTEVLIVGSGIAGISAAMEVAKENKNIILVSSGKFCSGASFYPGTWGLGMVVAEDEKDKEDFIDTIMEVGCQIPNKKLVTTLVENAEKDIKDFMGLGIKFRRPITGETVTPCFDKKPRKWYGFDFKTAKQAFKKLTDLNNVTIIEETNLIKILKDEEDSFSSGVFIKNGGEYIQISAKALIIATGGFTNIYKYNLSTPDMALNAHIPAKEAGCELVNMEFIQFIPANITPHYKTIFNERVFNYIKLGNNKGDNILENNLPKHIDEKSLLKERSTHGPFTCRLNSKYVDINMFKEYLKNKEGTSFCYPKDILNVEDTLIYNYFMWLKEKNALEADKIIILPFAHAANGGIAINEKAETSVKGIYAAGEVTGGVHGADRIGGLSTVNAMVFGKIAGKEVIKYINDKYIKEYKYYNSIEECLESQEKKQCTKNEDTNILKIENIIDQIRELMYSNACIIRNKEKLKETMSIVKDIKENFNLVDYLYNSEASKKAFIADNYIHMSEVILKAMIDRNESLGSHCREN